MSSSISYKDVQKTFTGSQLVHALKKISFTIEPGELFCLLGPSGCGKTTLLRCTAGLETLTGGRIFYDDTDVTTIPPFRRNIGMVFQSFALYPHMNVFENVAYGLRVRGTDEATMKRKVAEIMDLVGLPDVLKRNPSPTALSGGQQQRVAVARALVYDPQILLLDEPLANLDAKLRRHMRAEIRRIQKVTNITTIFVTHDQEEAMAIGDRLAIMKDGIIEQIGSSDEIYHNPNNAFVSNFIGKMNFFEGTIMTHKDGQYTVKLDMNNYALSFSPKVAPGLATKEGQRIKVGFRPEHLRIKGEVTEGEVPGRVRIIQHLGQVVRYEVALEAQGNERVIEVDMLGKVQGVAEGDQVTIEFPEQVGFIFAEGGEE